MAVLTDVNGKAIFSKTEIEASDYDRKKHGSLYIANVPLVDKDRKIKVKKGHAIAVPDGFIEKFQVDFFSPASVPPRGRGKGATPPEVCVITAGEDFIKEEKEALQRLKDERAASSQDIFKIIMEKEAMKREMDNMQNRIGYLEGIFESMKAAKEEGIPAKTKGRSRKS